MFANMAKQGYFKFERTFGCVTFYRVGDKWYFRQKSSLSSHRVKTSKRFANTMANARSLGRGARLASVVYRKLPESWKMFELYQKLTGIAAQLLREGKCDDDIVQALELQLYDWGYRKEISYPVIRHIKKKKIKLRTSRQCKKMEESENRSLMPEVGKRHKVQGTRSGKQGTKKIFVQLARPCGRNKKYGVRVAGVLARDSKLTACILNCKLPTANLYCSQLTACISVSRLTFHVSRFHYLPLTIHLLQPLTTDD
ncbi:MAG: hypothetical protein QM731_06525 [Chitinophagaceae bacterium]